MLFSQLKEVEKPINETQKSYYTMCVVMILLKKHFKDKFSFVTLCTANYISIERIKFETSSD